MTFAGGVRRGSSSIRPYAAHACDGSVTAGDRLGGVRLSSGAASTGCSDASDFIGTISRLNIAAPEDGRTPIALPPAFTDRILRPHVYV